MLWSQKKLHLKSGEGMIFMRWASECHRECIINLTLWQKSASIFQEVVALMVIESFETQEACSKIPMTDGPE